MFVYGGAVSIHIHEQRRTLAITFRNMVHLL